jgi:Fe-S-cluster containining protein
MYIIKKINAVNRTLRQADTHVGKFQSQSKLTCAPKCSLCCTKSNIETTVLEFLPAGYNLFLIGNYNKILENIETKTDNTCVFYNPLSAEGCCSCYEYRGLLCRLFGFSKKTEKTGLDILVTCNPIKRFNNLDIIQNKLIHAPRISDYYLKLYGIDPNLTVQYLPVNQSIKKAMQIVLLNFQYSKKPA